MASKAGLSKDRLDHVLVMRGLAQSRDAALRMILAGAVTVDGAVVDKPAKSVSADASISIHQSGARFVGRGGEKLAAALDRGAVDPRGVVCLDVGCSTGGFTDCLLQRGAARVYAVDVGYGQFDWRLRRDPRVILRERTNIRYIDAATIPEPVALVVIDVSFISLKKVLPPIVPFLRPEATLIALIKPQFEVGKGQVGRGGIVRDEAQRQSVLQHILAFAGGLGFQVKQTLDSPVRGKKGNQEILAIFTYRPLICDMKEESAVNAS
ncbi:TlyA family RNA methyltransferase [Nitrospira moscoviensis]|uniref:Putative rRNA methyltransferase YqxC n=1 Tax=Nitrospira moscoviensis TaxID=42253 RepID=A0A0K2GHY8_NITMO|nr:TlyA family RNA methyltransferase [Nitrospira moscoviensis]ALA60546.1 putative rRNA methyltransferase YqxC [Nitrospira moscoviensis]